MLLFTLSDCCQGKRSAGMAEKVRGQSTRAGRDEVSEPYSSIKLVGV